jgi:hypothetical protein
MAHFAVVAFAEEDDAIFAVPLSWIVGDMCMWPPFTSTSRVRQAARESTTPTDGWRQHKIRILHKCGMKIVYPVLSPVQ